MLEVELSNLRLRNPIMLASGILGSHAGSLNRIAEHAGAVVTKSVGLEGREGYKNPCVISWECGILNAVGLASPPAKEFARELKMFNGACPLIVSFFGSNPEEFAELVKIFDFANAFELNLSCPHAKGLGLEIGRDFDLVYEIIRAVKRNTDKPVFAKVSANLDYVELAKVCESAKADGIVAINTVRGMAIDIVSKRPILSNVSGGVSGKAIKPIALKCVWDIYEEVSIPVIGCGGISNWKDVVEFALAGARAVQIGSAFYYSYDVIKNILEGLESYLRINGVSFDELVGLAHKR
ncbi:dihydroorotate dehydrogenase [Archaeoglobus profundus]|uniref:Dihydroorotate dehydrogenase n=1 Tax=Archaeoglobus profundus (strain DSM 5631 / JCM 9629 / NBRC 100127 / Av18) TaxID=572546 RepID=D2RGR3_ARCPA|nr:dihydroorotate dehydrogenase [Archaeoglobus profundus]ADB57488.1 dihydroorotate dehydrogenase family protein [Archaeoglobus profundus DSM 5631]